MNTRISPLAGLVVFLLLSVFALSSRVAHATNLAADATAATNKAATPSFKLKHIRLIADTSSFRDKSRLRELHAQTKELKSELPAYVTHADLLGVTDALTQYMRDKGYKFHYARLGAQKITGGVVSITINAVSLSDIQIDNQSPINTSIVEGFFQDFVGQSVYQPDIDQQLLQLKQSEEVKAFAYYSRGQYQDSVRLNIKLAPSSEFKGSIKLDNYGSPETGQEQLLAQARWLSPTGRLDRLYGGLMASTNNDEINTYGYLRYISPLSSPQTRIELRASNNIFAVGNEFASLELNGDAKIYGASLHQDLLQTWRGKHQLSLSYEQKETDFDSAINDPSLEQDEQAQNLGLLWQWQHQYDWANQYIAAGYYKGDYSVDGYIEDEAYDKSVLAYYLGWATNSLTQSRLYSSFKLSLRGQYSAQRVSSFDQIALGGAWGIRAVQPGSFAADRGLVSSLEWHLPQLIQGRDINYWHLSPFLFTDYAFGDKLDLDGEIIDSASLLGSGLGLTVNAGRNVSLKLQGGISQHTELDSGNLLQEAGLLAELEYRWP